MRRSDREITDTNAIEQIIKSCTCCRIGLYVDGEVYIVPLSFGYERTQDGYAFYFHSARQGRKITAMRQNPKVGFEMDTSGEITTDNPDVACEYSVNYSSVIGVGTIEFIEDDRQKIHALNHIMYHSTQKRQWEYAQGMLQAVCVFKLTVDRLSCKKK